MKKILILAIAAVAVCAAPAKSKHPNLPSEAEVAKKDKANWGGVDYSAAPDGENSFANDLAQMRSMARGEAAKMKKLYDFCLSLIEGAKVVDMDPEAVLGDALKQLGRPIDPTPPRTHSNLSATPAQKLGFKSLQSAKGALARFGKGTRSKMAALLKTQIEARAYSDYNRLVRVTTQNAIKNGKLVESLQKVDKAWGKYLKIVDQISRGSGKWKYTAAQLQDKETQKKIFAEVLKASGLDCAFDADGRLHAKSSRSLHMLDNYFNRATDAELKKFEEGVSRSFAAHNAAATAIEDFWAWYAQNGLSIDPYPREFIRELYQAYADYINKNCNLLDDSRKVLKELRDESKPVGMLRKCKGISPNRAFFVRTGEVSGEAPSYMKRMYELAREAKIRFWDAVDKRIATAGRIQI